jgi:hypothetical protein
VTAWKMARFGATALTVGAVLVALALLLGGAA